MNAGRTIIWLNSDFTPLDKARISPLDGVSFTETVYSRQFAPIEAKSNALICTWKGLRLHYPSCVRELDPAPGLGADSSTGCSGKTGLRRGLLRSRLS